MSTLIEKLRDIERLRAGSEWPQWMKDTCDWGGPLSALAKEAADALEYSGRLQTLYDDLMVSYDRLRADTDAAIRARLKDCAAELTAEGRIVIVPVITDALLFKCDEAACHEDRLFYEMLPMEERWALIRAMLGAFSKHARSKP